MKRKNFVIVFVLVFSLFITSILPVFARNISEDGGITTVPIELEVTVPAFSVTLPTSLPLNVSSSGVVNTSNDIKIINNSHGSIKVTDVIVSGKNGWEIVDYNNFDITSEKVNAKKIAIKINQNKTNGENSIDFDANFWNAIDGRNGNGSNELPIVYNAKIPAQTNSLNGETVANIVFVVKWEYLS